MSIVSQETIDIFRRIEEAQREDRRREKEAAELVERVARAISLGEWSDSEHWQCRCDRDVWMDRARAAIEAMLPTTPPQRDDLYRRARCSQSYCRSA